MSEIEQREKLTSNIVELQENLRELLVRLSNAKKSYDQLHKENQILVKYIQNLKNNAPSKSPY